MKTTTPKDNLITQINTVLTKNYKHETEHYLQASHDIEQLIHEREEAAYEKGFREGATANAESCKYADPEVIKEIRQDERRQVIKKINTKFFFCKQCGSSEIMNVSLDNLEQDLKVGD